MKNVHWQNVISHLFIITNVNKNLSLYTPRMVVPICVQLTMQMTTSYLCGTGRKKSKLLMWRWDEDDKLLDITTEQ